MSTMPLLMRLQQHYRNLAPHVKERVTAKLLDEAIRRISDLELEEEKRRESEMKFEWETLDGTTQRARVFGGWLVKTCEDIYHHSDSEGRLGCGFDWRVAMVFVPDKNHEWVINSADTKNMPPSVIT